MNPHISGSGGAGAAGAAAGAAAAGAPLQKSTNAELTRTHNEYFVTKMTKSGHEDLQMAVVQHLKDGDPAAAARRVLEEMPGSDQKDIQLRDFTMRGMHFDYPRANKEAEYTARLISIGAQQYIPKEEYKEKYHLDENTPLTAKEKIYVAILLFYDYAKATEGPEDDTDIKTWFDRRRRDDTLFIR